MWHVTWFLGTLPILVHMHFWSEYVLQLILTYELSSADITSGTYTFGEEGYRPEDESQTCRFSREALNQLLKSVELGLQTRYAPAASWEHWGWWNSKFIVGQVLCDVFTKKVVWSDQLKFRMGLIADSRLELGDMGSI